MDLRIKHPSCIQVAAPSNSGKTEWVKRLLLNAHVMIHPPPRKIIWCYSQYQPAYTEFSQALPNITFIEGLPSQLHEMLDKTQPQCLILDDLMNDVGNDRRLADLFCRDSHHMNLTVIYLLQNLFNKGPQARTISLNVSYLVLFKNARDRSQIMHLARQMYPGNSKFLIDAYNNATYEPYKYLFLDLKPSTPESLRVRTGILPGEAQYCYIPAKKI